MNGLGGDTVQPTASRIWAQGGCQPHPPALTRVMGVWAGGSGDPLKEMNPLHWRGKQPAGDGSGTARWSIPADECKQGSQGKKLPEERLSQGRHWRRGGWGDGVYGAPPDSAPDPGPCLP